MEQIKKKMAVLRETLADAENRADKAEAELKDANDRASNVSPCNNCSGLCFVLDCSLLLWLATMSSNFTELLDS